MINSWIPEVQKLGQWPAIQTASQHFTQLAHNKRLVRFGAALLICLIYLGFYLHSIAPRSAAPKNVSPHKPDGSPRYAFITLLSPNSKEGVDQSDIAQDDYFLSTRVLNYQLRHSNKTKYPDPSVPFLVMVLPTVAENKRKILESEGATIIPVDYIRADWLKIPIPEWNSMMSKLWLWTYTEYDKILYIDADVYLIDTLYGIFEDPASQEQRTLANKTEAQDLGALPATYVMSGIVDGGSGSRENPMNHNYMNGGFFLLRPDQKLFRHLMKWVYTPDSFSTSMLEQNLINDVFKIEGPMPWQHMDPKWDTSCPEEHDIARGWKSLHSKLWKLHASPCDVDPRAGRMWYQTLGHMESFYLHDPDVALR